MAAVVEEVLGSAHRGMNLNQFFGVFVAFAEVVTKPALSIMDGDHGNLLKCSEYVPEIGVAQGVLRADLFIAFPVLHAGHACVSFWELSIEETFK